MRIQYNSLGSKVNTMADKQLALPIPCPECGYKTAVNCYCDWKQVITILRKRSPFRIIEEFLGIKEKKPHSFKEIEIAPGLRAIKYRV